MIETRQDVYEHYEVNESGMIMSPGRFEGELVYVPYLYEVYLHGGHLSDDGEIITIEVEDKDRAMFPELENASRAYIQVTDTGFIYCSVD